MLMGELTGSSGIINYEVKSSTIWGIGILANIQDVADSEY